MAKAQKVAGEKAGLRSNAQLLSPVDKFPGRLKDALIGKSNRQLAADTGLSEATVRDYLRGNSFPTLDRLANIARALGVRLAWLAAGDGPKLIGDSSSPAGEDSDFAYINNLKVEAAAGDGAQADSEVVNNRMAFRKDWLKQHGLQPEKLCFITARGDSMEPLIRSGDTLLVNVYFHTEGHEQVHGLEPGKRAGQEGIFVLRLDGGLVIKRLQPDLDGGYHVRSDNHEYEPLYKRAEDLVIVGRVEWIGRRL